jgi:hypothetical protein
MLLIRVYFIKILMFSVGLNWILYCINKEICCVFITGLGTGTPHFCDIYFTKLSHVAKLHK